MYRIVWVCSWLLLVFGSCQSPEQKPVMLPYYNDPDFTPVFLTEDQVRDSIDHQISPFTVQDQHRHTLTHNDIKGKIHVANFFFAACGVICPKMTNHLKKVADAYRQDKDVQFLSYSVTPWSDSLPVLQAFARQYQIDHPNWHLCTGKTGEIYTLARKSYFAEESLGYTKDSTEFLHTEHVLLIDSSLRIRGIYNGTLQLDMEQLEKDIRALRGVSTSIKY